MFKKSKMNRLLMVLAVALIAFGLYALDANAAKPPKAPVVSIASPSNGASFAPGTLIDFVGAAMDKEDGDLSDTLLWTSDIDGQIGTGSSFPFSLSDGVHTIVASATDSSDATGTASITITVEDPPEPPPVASWDIETVEFNANNAPIALAYAPDGFPSVAYELDDYPIFAHFNGTAWEAEVVEGVPSGRPSLAYGPDGNPSLSYTAGNSLKFAHFDGVSWKSELVDLDDANDSAPTYLVYDASGMPSISYNARVYSTQNNKTTGGGLKFARWNGSRWDVELVDVAGGHNSLAYDPITDHPSIAYYSASRKLSMLKLARWDGIAWNIETISESEAYTGVFPSLAYDATDNPTIVHKMIFGGGWCVEFVTWNASTGEWEGEFLEPPKDSYDSNFWLGELIYDAAGTAMVALKNDNLQKFARRNGPADWSIEVLEPNPIGDWNLSLALDPAGNPAMVYTKASDGWWHLRFAVRQP